MATENTIIPKEKFLPNGDYDADWMATQYRKQLENSNMIQGLIRNRLNPHMKKLFPYIGKYLPRDFILIDLVAALTPNPTSEEFYKSKRIANDYLENLIAQGDYSSISGKGIQRNV